MNRLETIDFKDRPFQGRLIYEADPDYKGYFHSHPGIEILMVHQGQGTVTIPQQVHRMEPGSVFVFQPYQLHHVSAVPTNDNPYIRSIVHFDPIALQPYLMHFKQLDQMLTYIWKGHMQIQSFQDMASRYPIEANLKYYKALEKNNGVKNNDHYASIALLLLQYLQTEISQLSIPIEAANHRLMSHTESILRWIEDHYAETFELSRIANELHLSKYYVSRLFKEETGSTVSDYIMALRSKEACRLLVDSELSVAEIGVRVGWPIASHFSQQFKRWVGCTPLQYRKRSFNRNETY